MGGYFICNGNEKVIRMLIMPRRNFVSTCSNLPPLPSITLLPVIMIASDTRISQNCKILINTSPLCFEYKFYMYDGILLPLTLKINYVKMSRCVFFDTHSQHVWFAPHGRTEADSTQNTAFPYAVLERIILVW